MVLRTGKLFKVLPIVVGHPGRVRLTRPRRHAHRPDAVGREAVRERRREPGDAARAGGVGGGGEGRGDTKGGRDRSEAGHASATGGRGAGAPRGGGQRGGPYKRCCQYCRVQLTSRTSKPRARSLLRCLRRKSKDWKVSLSFL